MRSRITNGMEQPVSHLKNQDRATRLKLLRYLGQASGVIHEEKHEREFTKTGGTFEMLQLWVNLPKAHKMSPPRYQALLREQFPW